MLRSSAQHRITNLEEEAWPLWLLFHHPLEGFYRSSCSFLRQLCPQHWVCNPCWYLEFENFELHSLSLAIRENYVNHQQKPYCNDWMLEGTLSRLTCVKISYDFAMHEGRYPVFQASYGVRSSLLLQQPTTTTPAHWANHARQDLWERKVPDIKPRAAICVFPYQHLPLLARIQRQNYHPKKLFWNFILLISCYSKSTRF